MMFLSLQVSSAALRMNILDVLNKSLHLADGVHPNKRMYAKWSESLGKKMCERIMPQLALIEKKQHLNKGKARLTKTTQMKRQSIM